MHVQSIYVCACVRVVSNTCMRLITHPGENPQKRANNNSKLMDSTVILPI